MEFEPDFITQQQGPRLHMESRRTGHGNLFRHFMVTYESFCLSNDQPGDSLSSMELNEEIKLWLSTDKVSPTNWSGNHTTFSDGFRFVDLLAEPAKDSHQTFQLPSPLTVLINLLPVPFSPEAVNLHLITFKHYPILFRKSYRGTRRQSSIKKFYRTSHHNQDSNTQNSSATIADSLVSNIMKIRRTELVVWN